MYIYAGMPMHDRSNLRLHHYLAQLCKGHWWPILAPFTIHKTFPKKSYLIASQKDWEMGLAGERSPLEAQAAETSLDSPDEGVARC